ncbi:MAG: hypothetical protein HY905_06870 [Deltaproteobacteria bacterium]|nr:hypothetical protein [Deltaproteobacteria bacterium]
MSVGRKSGQHLERSRFREQVGAVLCTPILHYSPNASRHRKRLPSEHMAEYRKFMFTEEARQKLLAFVEGVLLPHHLDEVEPAERKLVDERVNEFRKTELSKSRRKLVFTYCWESGETAGRL